VRAVDPGYPNIDRLIDEGAEAAITVTRRFPGIEHPNSI
jgi:hypothetical protein